MRTSLLIFLLAAMIPASAEPGPGAVHQAPGQSRPAPKDATAIRRLMTDQAAAWNRGNIDDFMKGYWNNDSLVFIGKSGPSYGYAVLRRSCFATILLGRSLRFAREPLPATNPAMTAPTKWGS